MVSDVKIGKTYQILGQKYGIASKKIPAALYLIFKMNTKSMPIRKEKKTHEAKLIK